MDILVTATGQVLTTSTGSVLYMPEDPNAFVTEWNMPSGDFTLPTNSGTYNATIDWGDGTETSTITTWDDADLTHNYASAGTYEIKITGTFGHLIINNGPVKTYLTKVIQWGNVSFGNAWAMFYGCSNLTEIPTGAITGMSAVPSATSMFYGTGITSIPSGLFDNMTSVTTFDGTFRDCTSLTTIPSGLFDNNTGATSFSSLFYNTAITTVPADLFRYNTLTDSTAFEYTFRDCTALETVPANLFKYNTGSYSFIQTFTNCYKLQLHSTIFYADGEQSTRFAGDDAVFNLTFYIDSAFTGTQGTAPDLWNCTFGTLNSGNCFFGHGSGSLSNWASIPSAWGGPA